MLDRRYMKIPGFNYAHDFVLTKDYYIFHMTPFVLTSFVAGLKIVSGYESPGSSMRYYPELPSKLVMIHRTKIDEPPILLNAPPVHIFHYGTIQESDEKLSFTAACMGKNFTMEFENKVWLSNFGQAPGRLIKFDITRSPNGEFSLATETVVSHACEFPAVNRFLDTKQTMCYLMANTRKKENVPFRDVIKFFHTGEEPLIWKSRGVVGEPAYAPKGEWDDGEDNGYLIVQVFIPETKRTEFAVIDARTMKTVATIKLKHHVPFGFHGTWTRETFLRPREARL